MSNDEYIDYSCSTPLERLSRDVQSLLRGWHIISGSDRHVSFNRKQRFSSSPLKRHLSVPDLSSSKCTDSDYDDDDDNDNDNDNDNDAGSTGSPRTRPATAPIGRLSIVGETEVADAQNGTDQVTDCSSPPRKKPDETVLGTEHLTPLREIERPSPLRGHRRSRSEDTQYVDTLNFDLPSHSQPSQTSQTLSPIRLNRVRSDNNSLNSPHRVKFASGGGVKLIRSGKLTLTTTPPNSAHRPQDRMTVELDLCLWDGPPIATTRSGYTSRPPPAASNLTSATIPLSLRTYRSPENGHKEVVEHEDIISNLSSLLGIGQHLTLTPANDDALNSLLDTTVDALLRLNHPSGTLSQRSKGKMRSPSKFLFSSSTIASAAATKTTTSSDDGFTDADGNTIVLGPAPPSLCACLEDKEEEEGRLSELWMREAGEMELRSLEALELFRRVCFRLVLRTVVVPSSGIVAPSVSLLSSSEMVGGVGLPLALILFSSSSSASLRYRMSAEHGLDSSAISSRFPPFIQAGTAMRYSLFLVILLRLSCCDEEDGW